MKICFIINITMMMMMIIIIVVRLTVIKCGRCVSVQVCSVLAGSGLLDVWEHSCFCRRHDCAGGLHRTQVLHSAGIVAECLLLTGSDVL